MRIRLTLSILADIWKKSIAWVCAETWYNSLMYVRCVSFRNELTNLSYMLSFGVNFGIHRRNLLTKIRPLLAPWALCINSSSLFSSMLNSSFMGTSILSSSSSKNECLFSGTITLTSFALRHRYYYPCEKPPWNSVENSPWNSMED